MYLLSYYYCPTFSLLFDCIFLTCPAFAAFASCIFLYLEVYWPCAGGLSAVNAIGTQLRDPINSGLTQWRIWRFK